MNLLEILVIVWCSSAVFNLLSLLLMPIALTGGTETPLVNFDDLSPSWNLLVFFAPFVAILFLSLWFIIAWIYVDYFIDWFVKKIRR
jgi:hypothetical protein